MELNPIIKELNVDAVLYDSTKEETINMIKNKKARNFSRFFFLSFIFLSDISKLIKNFLFNYNKNSLHCHKQKYDKRKLL